MRTFLIFKFHDSKFDLSYLGRRRVKKQKQKQKQNKTKRKQKKTKKKKKTV